MLIIIARLIIMTRLIIGQIPIIRHIRNITKKDTTRVMSIIIAVFISGQEQTAGTLVQPAALVYDVALNCLNIITYPFHKIDVMILHQ